LEKHSIATEALELNFCVGRRGYSVPQTEYPITVEHGQGSGAAAPSRRRLTESGIGAPAGNRIPGGGWGGGGEILILRILCNIYGSEV